MAADRDLVTGVVQLGNLLLRRLAPVFERAKITPQQWSVLSVLAADDAPVTLVALARRLSVTKQNMTGMMSRLEQVGLAERSGDPHDLRTSHIRLTRKGRLLVERVRPAYLEWMETVGGSALSEREVQSLTRSINRLIDELEAD